MVSIYNSRNLAYKNPFGAVKAGQTITFTLRVPSYYGCTTPYLFLKVDQGEPAQYLLEKSGKDGERDIFRLQLTLDQVGLYFYWFDLWIDYRKLFQGFNGEATETTGDGKLYQLTVYEPSYSTPKSMQGGVMYQIFPDRFWEGNPDKEYSYNERIYRDDKQKEPYFWPDNIDNGYLTKDYYGGDLFGIEKRLPFLYTLGVNWIYLNPIFEAHSNHRYNTADYLNVDPYLGTNEDFTRLCEKAATFGIKIILDGVFSHTGSDSIYFNKEARYPSLGAWQSQESLYRDWYFFHEDGSYKSWWGFQTLPECDKHNQNFRNFICGHNGVIDTWIKRGAAGFRLDVADELPDDFIVEIHKAVKRNGKENLLIGEVWEDASNKEAYSKRRQYFSGNELDGVMNYPFREAIIQFLRNHDALAFQETIGTICENYPAPAMAATTNHLSTHDTERIITALAGEPYAGQDRDWQSGRRLSKHNYQHGLSLLRLAFVLQFTLPGVPCVYYGDEIAMQGYKDPFNRCYYDWNSGETHLIPLMMQLAKLRKECSAFKNGHLHFTEATNGFVAFERKSHTSVVAIAVNCSTAPVTTHLLGKEVTVSPLSFSIQTNHM